MNTLKDFLEKVQELEIAARRLAEKNPRAFDTAGYREDQIEFYRAVYTLAGERPELDVWWFFGANFSFIKKNIMAAMAPPSRCVGRCGQFMIEKKGNVFYLRQEKATSGEATAGRF